MKAFILFALIGFFTLTGMKETTPPAGGCEWIDGNGYNRIYRSADNNTWYWMAPSGTFEISQAVAIRECQQH